MGSLFGTSWKAYLRSLNSLVFLECRRDEDTILHERCDYKAEIEKQHLTT